MLGRTGVAVAGCAAFVVAGMLPAASAAGAGTVGNDGPVGRPGQVAAGDVKRQPEPTLGRAGAFGPHGIGFGKVRPVRIYYGGDPTGEVRAITWRNWGGPTATGTGTGYYEPEGAPVAESYPQPARIKAYDLGRCHGKPAYLKVQWWYPTHGETFNPTENSYNLCKGP